MTFQYIRRRKHLPLSTNPFKHNYVQEKGFWVPQGWNSFVHPKFMQSRRKIISVDIENRTVLAEVTAILKDSCSFAVGDRYDIEGNGFVREIDGKKLVYEDFELYKQLL